MGLRWGNQSRSKTKLREASTVSCWPCICIAMKALYLFSKILSSLKCLCSTAPLYDLAKWKFQTFSRWWGERDLNNWLTVHGLAYKINLLKPWQCLNHWVVPKLFYELLYKILEQTVLLTGKNHRSKENNTQLGKVCQPYFRVWLLVLPSVYVILHVKLQIKPWLPASCPFQNFMIDRPI